LLIPPRIVKFWDLRAQLSSTRRIYISESAASTLDRTADRGKRSRGIISLVEANQKIYAMCNDARIHSHSIQSPQLALPTFYTHKNLTTSSFYLKLAVSPCENYLACGTSNGRFAMWGIQRDFLGRWDAEKGEAVGAVEGVECGFGGHTRQVGAIDWAADQVRITLHHISGSFG
jgi:denticleless